MAGQLGRRGAPRGRGRYFSSPVPPCMLGAPALPRAGGGLTCLPLPLSPQNTALDKEGQIFGSKLGADGGRPGLEPAAPPEPPPHPGPAAPAPGSERAGTWRRHRD